ncbi:MAG: cell division regulator GpsB [Bacilli bacterium]|nr:cell division regulator GpsB [Bacilli bacterium]
MIQDRILLTVKDILDKEFKIDTRGFRPQEVDKFLDVIIRDYEEFITIIRELETDKKEILEDNLRLKQEIRTLKMKLDVVKDAPVAEITNADLLRRLSSLEKIIYGKE